MDGFLRTCDSFGDGGRLTHIDVPGCTICVAQSPKSASRRFTESFYMLSLPLYSSRWHSVQQTVSVSFGLARKLHWRYIEAFHCHYNSESDSSSAAVVRTDGEAAYGHLDDCLPGAHDTLFLRHLYEAVKRKFGKVALKDYISVAPDLYSLWSFTSSITTELFTDSITESGVMERYCSFHSEDKVFGSLGSWEENECTIEGAGGIIPFDKSFIHGVMEAFDNGARSLKPYCRCAVIPLDEQYSALEVLNDLTSKGILLLRIPPGSLLSTTDLVGSSYHNNGSYESRSELGIFIWRNREYLQKYPPPDDIELLYDHWLSRACRNPSIVHVDLSAFSTAFPSELRMKKKLSEFIDKFS